MSLTMYLLALVCNVPIRYLPLLLTIAAGQRIAATEYSQFLELKLYPGTTISSQIALERLLQGPMRSPIYTLVRIL